MLRIRSYCPLRIHHPLAGGSRSRADARAARSGAGHFRGTVRRAALAQPRPARAAAARSPSPAATSRPHEYYMGATGGGLWKTTDGGTTWKPVTDGLINYSSVGAVAVSPSNPDVVYIGTGESDIRGNIIQGGGAYKSTDAGKTWTHIGLDRHAGHREDPRPPDQPGSRLRRRLRPSRGAESRSAASSDRRTAARRGTRSCSATTRPAPTS